MSLGLSDLSLFLLIATLYLLCLLICMICTPCMKSVIQIKFIIIIIIIMISGAAIFFEFKHYKPKKRFTSTKCFAFMEMDEIKAGPIVIEL